MGNIGNPNIFVWALFGGAVANWVMMRWKWLPDPPPPAITGRYVVALVAGVLAGVVGGYLGIAGSNPMPGLAVLGAGSASLVVTGAIAILSSAGRGGAGR